MTSNTKLHLKLHLNPVKILLTAQKLALRIQDRFPDSGISGLARDLSDVAGMTVRQVEFARRPIIGLRILAWLLIGFGLAVAIQLAGRLQTNWDLGNPGEFIQSFQAALESSVFLGAAVLFVLGWDQTSQSFALSSRTAVHRTPCGHAPAQ
jgi:hypothetical protein